MDLHIYLSRGKFAVIDAADYPKVAGYSWHATPCYRREDVWYTSAHDSRPGMKSAISMHRLIMQDPKDLWVDHVDGDGLNNRRSNLRVCTPRENLRNKKKPTQKTGSQFKGVYYDKKTKKWRAQIGVDYRRVKLGYFVDEVLAAYAYDAAALYYFGRFANFNFPEAAPFMPPHEPPMPRTKLSKYRGVTYDKQKQRWRASLQHSRKNHTLGRFHSEEEAARAYDTGAAKIFGTKAVLNFPCTLATASPRPPSGS